MKKSSEKSVKRRKANTKTIILIVPSLNGLKGLIERIRDDGYSTVNGWWLSRGWIMDDG